MGETRLDIGPGERNRICANSVKPGSKVGVNVGSGVVGTGVSVGRGVSVAVGANALAVAKTACPVNATTVEMWLGGKAVGVDTVCCEQAAKSVRRDAMIRNLCFIVDGNQYPAGSIEFIISKILRDVFIYRP
jgi:ApbE superfamily uncharacterized protein (UPF0280 family)